MAGKTKYICSTTHANKVILENGCHEISLKAIQLTDLKIEFRTPTNHRGKNELSSVCQLNVIKGEEIPQLGECPPVIGIADEECKFGLSYTLEGQPQSLLEVCVIKDGKELTIGKYRLSQPVLAKIMLENRRIISINRKRY